MSRTKNASRNVVWGVFYKLISILIPFVTRTVIIYVLGIQYAGIGNLFASILSVLSLAELGVGEALVYNMYKPLAVNDTKTVCALLKFYRDCYRVIGIIVTVAGLIILPFLDILVNGERPSEVNLYYLFIIYLVNTVSSYFLFAYKQSLLVASQRGDIGSKIHLVLSILTSFVQIIGLMLFKTYYAFAIIIPLSTIIYNLIISFLVDRKYPQYKCEGKIGKESLQNIKKNVAGMIFQKIGNTILNSADTIIISSFMGISMVAYYNNYYYIVNAACGVMGAISAAITPSVGNSIAKETKEKNFFLFSKIGMLEQWIIVFFSACMIGLFQPFMILWLGEEYLLPQNMVIIFVCYFYAFKMNDICYIYRQAAGLWWEGRMMPIVSSVINVTLNLLLIKRIGLAGIALSTVISVLFVNVIWGSVLVFKEYFEDTKKIKNYFITLVVNMIIAAIIVAVTGAVCYLVKGTGVLQFIIKIVICILVPNVLFVLLNLWNSNFKECLTWLINKGKGQIER